MSRSRLRPWAAHLPFAFVAALLGGLGPSAKAAAWDNPGIGAPLVRTFTAKDTGALSSYRCALRARSGNLYVGHDGLHEYDGETWRAMPLPEGSAVRSLAEDEAGRIWVGGENLLGFLDRGESNQPRFVSVLPSLPAEHRADLGCVSAVFALPKGHTIVVAENRVFSLRPTGVQVWSLSATRRLTAWRNEEGEVFVVQPGASTLRVTEAGLEPSGFPEPYASMGIEWCVTFRDRTSLLSAGQRLLLRRNGRIMPVETPIAERLREDRVTGAILLDGGFVALATLRHGILVLNTAGEQVAAIDRADGLPDNRIVHLAASVNQGLTATTPEAVVVFCDGLSTTVFDGRHGLPPRRIVALAETSDGIHLASGAKVFRLPAATADRPARSAWLECAELEDNISGLVACGKRLAAATPTGINLLAADRPAARVRAAEIVALGSWITAPEGLAWIEGTRLQRGRLVADQLVPEGPPQELDLDACALLEDPQGAHWISTAHSGVVRVAPAEDIASGKPALRAYRSNLRNAGSLAPRLFRAGSRVLAATDAGLVYHSATGDRFVTVPGVTNVRIHAVSDTEADGTVWVALSQRDRAPFQVRIARLRPAEGGIACELVRLPPLPLEEPPGAILAAPGQAGTERVFWLGMTGKVLRIESPGTPAASPPLPPAISALSIFDDARGTSPLKAQQRRVAFDNSGLRFDIAVPEGRLGQRVHLESRLVDFDADWVPLGEIPSRVFRGLRDRDYRFEARSIDALGRPSPVAVFEFSVQPPWWRSAPAYMSYALALVLLSGLAFFTRLRLGQRHRRELEMLVAQRTRELAQANAAKSDFLAHINHEIRNPLNGVIGLSAMLAQQHHNDQSRQLARSLKACAGYLGSVVDNVLDLARIESGRIEITPQRFEPRLLLDDIAEMFRLQVEEAGGRISWSVDPDLPPTLVGDVHRIRQVLVNFAANAARYARGADVRLSARRRSQTFDAIAVVFTVSDTGPGIAPAEQSRIFEKFARGGRRMESEQNRGFGVGLALVRNLAQLLGGEADVDSQLGYGARFRLTIPLATADSVPRPESAAGPTLLPAPGLRVLVIDDQSFNRLVLRDQLERLGCKVEESADGPSAHLLLQARAHHMAFVDLDLPGLDGLNLIRRIRQEGAERPVFLVATTASATRTIEEKVLAAGADAFLPKPISLPHLAALLEACGARLAPPRSTVAPPAPASEGVASGLFAEVPLPTELLRTLQTELDHETQSLVTSWRQADADAARRHAHRIASLGIIARDDGLLEAARTAEEALRHNHAEASLSVDALQSAAHTRIRLLRTSAGGPDTHGKN